MRHPEYLLDTDVCINIIRSKPDSIIRKVVALSLEQVSLSTITLAELELGVAKSSKPEQNYLALTAFLAPLRIRHFDASAARCYGMLRADLENKGQRIGSMDMLIAAQALASNLVLVTNNYGDFVRVKGLSTESWYEVTMTTS